MDDEAVPSGPDVEDATTAGKEGHECGDAQCIGREIEEFLKASAKMLQVERGVKAVLKHSDVIRDHMLAGNLEAGTDGMNALTEFVDSVPSHFTGQVLFILASQALYGDAFMVEDV